jgi:RNA polymerase sigma factor (sigma-70 family)
MNNQYYPEGTDLTYTNITHAQERELFAKAKAGDTEAREFLITNHLLFAANEGRKWSRGKLPEDEVISAANYAVMTAFDRFDTSWNNRFSSFLRPFIRGAIAALWRSKNLVDSPEGGQSAVPLTEYDISVNEADFISIGCSDHGRDDTLVKRPRTRREASEEQTVEQDEHAEFLLRLLENAKGCLTEQEATVIRLYFGEERITLDKIAGKLGLKDRRDVHQIKTRAIEKLKKHLARSMADAGVER